MPKARLLSALMTLFPSLSTSLAQGADGPPLQSFRAEAVTETMLSRNPQPDFPEKLQGLWWMDGNPLPDNVVSFAAASFDPNTRILTLPVYAPGTVSFDDSREGRLALAAVQTLKYHYEIEFNDDLTFGRLTTVLGVGALAVHAPVVLTDYVMEELQDGLWIRKSKLLTKPVASHNFTRIVRGDGTKEAVFERYLKEAAQEQIILSR